MTYVVELQDYMLIMHPAKNSRYIVLMKFMIHRRHKTLNVDFYIKRERLTIKYDRDFCFTLP